LSASPVPSNHLRIGSLEQHNWLTEFVRGLPFIAESDANKVESKQCPNGGTGRRARFRTWFSQGSGGSSPLSGTIQVRQILLHLLSAPRPVRFSHPSFIWSPVQFSPHCVILLFFCAGVLRANASQPGHGVGSSQTELRRNACANPRSARGSGILCANPSNASRFQRF
jgi:hypothetical protein